MRKSTRGTLLAVVMLLIVAVGCATTGPGGAGPKGAPETVSSSTAVARRAAETSRMRGYGRIEKILQAMESVRDRLILPTASEDPTLIMDALRITQDLPDHPYSWLLLGIAHRAQGDPAAARNALLRALELEPELEEVNLHLGWMAEEEDNLSDAEFYFAKAWKTSRDTDVLKPYAYLKLRQGQPDSARDMLSSVILNHPQDLETVNNMALALDLTGQNREALALLKGLPDEAVEGPILETRALMELKEGRTDLATADLEDRLTLGDPGPDTVLLLGILNLQKGNLKSAEESFREVISKAPSDPAAYLNLGLTLRRMGRFKEARTIYTEGILETNHPDIHLNLGVLYELYLDDPAMALDHYRHYTQIAAGGAQRVGGWIDYLSGIAAAPRADKEEGP